MHKLTIGFLLALMATHAQVQQAVMFTGQPGAVPVAVGAGGSGCTVAGTVGQIVINDGAAGCSSATATVSGSTITGNLTGNVTGNVSGTSGSTTGNAATATALATARAIGGVNFDGTAAIVPQTVQIVDAAGDTTTFPLLGTSATGSLQPTTDTGLTFNATTKALGATSFVGALTGNASTATALATPRAINGTNFDGTAAITVTAAAGTLTGATLNATVTASSLTSFGASPTLTTPTIASFANAAHNHTNAAGGAQLTDAALSAAVGVAKGGTNCTVASVTCFNNITGFTAAGTTGTTSTNLVFSTSPTLVTPVLGVATGTSVALGGCTITGFAYCEATNSFGGPAIGGYEVAHLQDGYGNSYSWHGCLNSGEIVCNRFANQSTSTTQESLALASLGYHANASGTVAFASAMESDMWCSPSVGATISFCLGQGTQASHIGAGAVTNLIGYLAYTNTKGAVSPSLNVGIYIQDQSGVGSGGNYNLYSAGNGANYFGGGIISAAGVQFPVSTSSLASMQIQSGVAKTSGLTAGDLWNAGGILQYRGDNTETKTLTTDGKGPTKTMVSGTYYGPEYSGYAATNALTNGVELAVQISIPAKTTLVRFGTNVVTTAAGTGGVLRFCLYQDNAGRPGTLIVDGGTVASTTTGAKEVTISQSVDPGVYWLSVIGQGAPTPQATIAMAVGNSAGVGYTSLAAATANAGSYSQTGITGACANWTGSVTTAGLMPILVYRN